MYAVPISANSVRLHTQTPVAHFHWNRWSGFDWNAGLVSSGMSDCIHWNTRIVRLLSLVHDVRAVAVSSVVSSRFDKKQNRGMYEEVTFSHACCIVGMR